MFHLYYSKVLKNTELLYLIKISGKHKMKKLFVLKTSYSDETYIIYRKEQRLRKKYQSQKNVGVSHKY